MTNAVEVGYVDGIRVPDEVGWLEYLRRKEKSSPRSCLLLFVPTSVKIQDVEDFHVVAGKMQYEDFHVYVYDQHRRLVTEFLHGPPVNADELRSGPNGPFGWPDQNPNEK
jgi:hypothetical protein